MTVAKRPKIPGKPKPAPPGGILGPPTGIPPWTRVYPPGTIQNYLPLSLRPHAALGAHPLTLALIQAGVI